MVSMQIVNKIKAVCKSLEQDYRFDREDRYWLASPDGGGFAKRFTIEEAIDEAMWLTGDEVRECDSLYIHNDWQQTIALFYDGRAFIPVEFEADDGTGQ